MVLNPFRLWSSATTEHASVGSIQRILPLYSPRPCFVLPASIYQSALLSSSTVSDRFFHEARNRASMQHVTNAEYAI